jgi:exopolyphosphatase / guanosine-5'-triphosphate,3'-diphosphate pyrophosphatase
MTSVSLCAAVDLGSNSFRLEIARMEHGVLRRVDYLKETVRQGAGLDAQRCLTPEAMERGWETLARFGERIRGMRAGQVRAVATQTLREAHNREVFLQEGARRLGFPIEVIGGREEARLIYRGVTHNLSDGQTQRLVIDIGGRSTELILGQGRQPSAMESYRVGSVAWASRYFEGGKLSSACFDSAIVAAKAVLDQSVGLFGRSAWHAKPIQVLGSAGTIGAASEILTALAGAEPSTEGTGNLSLQNMMNLRSRLEVAGHVDNLELPGLKEDRKPVIGAGLSVLIALIELLELPAIQAVDTGLRHGVLLDLLDDSAHEGDVRNLAVQGLAQRFGADSVQANWVSDAAAALWDTLSNAPSLNDFADSLIDKSLDFNRLSRKLKWACMLHEIGASISHTDCHRHSAYIIDHADVAGFTQAELHRLSLLVLGHRGKLRKLAADFDNEGFVRQLICLRLAVIFCHARQVPQLKGIRLQCKFNARRFELSLPTKWAQRFPQSWHLLQQETQSWGKTPWTLELSHGD